PQVPTARSPNPDALVLTTARSPVARVTSTVETAGWPAPGSSPATSTRSTPLVASSRRTTSASGPPPTAVTSVVGTPSATAVAAALAAGPPNVAERDRATTFSSGAGRASTTWTTSRVTSPQHTSTRPSCRGDAVHRRRAAVG